jgi:hypothetical protein
VYIVHPRRTAYTVLVLLSLSPIAARAIPLVWSWGAGESWDDFAHSIALNALSGHQFVTGSVRGTTNLRGWDLGGEGTRDVFLVKLSSGVVFQGVSFGGTELAEGYGVAADAAGGALVTGKFSGTMDFGGSGFTSAGGDDIFLARYDGNLVHVWSKRLGGASTDHGYAVAMDAVGNVFITGLFEGSVDFGGGTLVGSGSADIFLAKYDAGGNHLWSKWFGGSAYDFGSSVAVDGSGNVVVGGAFQGSVDFGESLSAGSYDGFVARYAPNGSHLWSQRFGGIDIDQAGDVAVDGLGNMYVCGSFRATVNLGGGNLISAGVDDVLLAKYGANGLHLWSDRYGGVGSDVANSIAVDDAGYTVATGSSPGRRLGGGI